jgi:pimeloyl-ACP methyl ester carboxylesterase
MTWQATETSSALEGDMPFVINQGARIHYETFGSGSALLMHHGTFHTGTDWIDIGYVDAFRVDHRVILLDSRGHGQSDKPHEPAAYGLALHASDVIAVLDEVGVRKADYLGYSLGGWIGFGLVKLAADRFRSFTLGGSHPYAEDMQSFRDAMPHDRNVFAATIDQAYGTRLTPAMRSRLLANDLDALRALTQDRGSNADVLPSMTMPCLLFVGELDPRFAKVQQLASDLPNGTLLNLAGYDHIDANVRGELVIPRLKAFLSQVGG